MKTLYLFAPKIDIDKFKAGGYFVSMKHDENGNPIYTDLQKQRIREVESEFKIIDKYPIFDFTINLSTEQTVEEMCLIITDKLLPVIGAESDKVVARCEFKFLDKLTNTWHTQKDDVIIGFKMIPLSVERSQAKAEYNYMVKSYVNELCYKYATRVSADDVMNMLRMEV